LEFNAASHNGNLKKRKETQKNALLCGAVFGGLLSRFHEGGVLVLSVGRGLCPAYGKVINCLWQGT
jgi:hypothetical protein